MEEQGGRVMSIAQGHPDALPAGHLIAQPITGDEASALEALRLLVVHASGDLGPTTSPGVKRPSEALRAS